MEPTAINEERKPKKKKNRFFLILSVILFVIIVILSIVIIYLLKTDKTEDIPSIKYVEAEVMSAGINSDGHIIIAYTNGKTVDMGEAELSFALGKKISSIKQDENGNIIAVYEDGTTQNLGKPQDYEQVFYSVTFVDINGKVIETLSTENEIIPPEAPTIEGKTFIKWDNDLTEITEDVTVHPIYEDIIAVKTYTVTFLDGDGNIIDTQTVNEGEGAIAPNEPTKSGMFFHGWDKDFSNVTEDTIVSATFTEKEYYTVTFCGEDGSILKTQTIAKGKTAKAPTPPKVKGKIFVKWSKKYTNVKKDITTTAIYTYNEPNVFEFTETDGIISLSTAGIVAFNKLSLEITVPVGMTVSSVKGENGFNAILSGGKITVTYNSDADYMAFGEILTFGATYSSTLTLDSTITEISKINPNYTDGEPIENKTVAVADYSFKGIELTK